VALRLNNKAGAAFQEYAKTHAGEYVAIVLDGVVMATLPIEEQVAKGHFAFTGDYTEAESRLLAQSLYKDPLGFPLLKVRDIEVPAP
jgi:preprotein translocase subunit SecD